MVKKKSSRKTTKKEIISQEKVFVLLGALVVLFSFYNILQVSSFSGLLDGKIFEAKEAARPAELQMTVIQFAGCSDCFNIQSVVDSVKKSHVNITSERSIDSSSPEARDLIRKYGVDKIPTVIFQGETQKAVVRNFEEVDDALVFKALTPPYIDAATNQILGRVSAIVLKDFSCDKCIDLTQIIDGLKQSGVAIVSVSDVDRNSVEGQSMIDKYGFETLPALILSTDLAAYGSGITDSWKQLGTVEADAYVSRMANPPYVDLAEDKVVGLISMTVLGDESCEECYNPDTFHKPILARMGVVFGEESLVDVSSTEGQALVDKYSITKVPTVVLVGDMDKYPVLVNAWEGVGSVESNGDYVFRSVEVARQAYKDLSTGEVVTP